MLRIGGISPHSSLYQMISCFARIKSFSKKKFKSRLQHFQSAMSFCVLLLITSLIASSSQAGDKAGVVTNSYACSAIGRRIMMKGGSAVDAAIAALFCEGVSMPQTMGIGGGFLMTLYKAKEKKAYSLVARETAPRDAHENMFKGNATLAEKSGLSIAVPGELRGYWEVHKRFGKLPWRELVMPSVKLCENGHLITSFLSKMLREQEEGIMQNKGLRKLFINPVTNRTYEEGHYARRPILGKTLNVIAEEGADALYTGSLAENFVLDIQNLGGIITLDDMERYKPQWMKPIRVPLPNHQTLVTAPLPGSGIILAIILNILNGFLDVKTPDSLINWQRIVESFKFGYGIRTELGDPRFIKNANKWVQELISPQYAKKLRAKVSDTRTSQDPTYYGGNATLREDHGTANIVVLAANGDAVAVTSTVNLYFGSGLVSQSTGIILNDQMDDFSDPNIVNHYGVPPSPSNLIEPYKRPMSSMCPSIIVNKKGAVDMIIGAAGGTRITSSVALVIIKHLWYGIGLTEAVASARLHHQLYPMEIYYDPNFDHCTASGLSRIGHKSFVGVNDGFAAVTAISKFTGHIQGTADPRRHGQVSLY